MKILIIFNKNEIINSMTENNWNIANLSYFWGISIKNTRKIFKDEIIIDSKFISKIVYFEE